MRNKVNDYILNNGLPKQYQHAYKMSGLSLDKFIQLNYTSLLGFIMTEKYIDQQEQKKIEQDITKEIIKAVKDSFKQ